MLGTQGRKRDRERVLGEKGKEIRGRSRWKTLPIRMEGVFSTSPYLPTSNLFFGREACVCVCLFIFVCSLWMCVYACMYVCVCTCVYMCMHINIYIYIYAYISVCVYHNENSNNSHSMKKNFPCRFYVSYSWISFFIVHSEIRKRKRVTCRTCAFILFVLNEHKRHLDR